MSIFRKFSRKQEKLQSEERRMRPKDLMAKVGMSLFMLGYAVMPKAGEAADLADVNTVYNPNGSNVSNIYAQTVDGKIAVNRFGNFSVGEKTIANMLFKQTDKGPEASSLFNFVKNDININGTVNAIQNSKVGGNLYFLSPKSILVGSKGVINAGAVTLMSGGKFPSDMSDAEKYADAASKGSYLLDDNKYGNVTVNGNINATDFIRLGSSKSIIVKKADGAENGPNLVTNEKIDFAKLVNIEGKNGTVNSGLTGNLELVRSNEANGNIMLAALATVSNEDGKAIQGWMDVAGDNTVMSKIEVGEGTTIKSDKGVVSIGAKSTRANSFGDLVTFGDIGGAEAIIDIGGTVQGDKVNISAEVLNKYRKNIYENLTGKVKGKLKEALIEALGDFGDLDLVFIGNRANAEINFNEHAKVTATGQDTYKAGKLDTPAMNIKASSTVDIKSNGNADSGGTAGGGNYFTSSFMYTYIENDATINVKDGAQLEATNKGEIGGSISMEADAVSTSISMAMTSSSAKAVGEDKVSAAVVATVDNTNSHINFEEGSDTSATSSISAVSVGYSGIWANSVATPDDSTYIGSAITVALPKSVAEINANGKLTSGAYIGLFAEDDTTINTGADNYVLSEKYPKSWLNTAKDIIGDTVGQKIVDPVAAYLKNKFSDLFKGNEANAFQQLADDIDPEEAGKDVPKENSAANVNQAVDTAFSVGASINIVVGSQEANVNVGEKASLVSGGDIDINATKKLEDLNLIARGAASATNSGATIDASLVYAKLDNNANVNIKGNATNHASLNAGGKLNINSNARYVWNRRDTMYDFLKSSWQTFTNDFDDWDKLLDQPDNKSIKAVNEAMKAYEANPTTENFNKLSQAAADSNFWTRLNNFVKSVGRIPSDAVMVISAAESFLDATSYVNVNAGSSSGPASRNPAVVNGAVAAAITDISTRSRVFVGKDAVLNAGGALEAKATAEQTDVNYYGALGGVFLPLMLNGKISPEIYGVLSNLGIDLNVMPALSTGANAVGGTIGVDDNTIQSSVIVAEGAQLTGSSINLKSITDHKTALANIGGGSAQDWGATGTFNILNANTASLVLVDDEATLTATGKDGINLNAKNDSLVVNIAGDLTGGEHSIGVSAGYVQNNVNTIAGIVDIDKDAKERTSADEIKRLNSIIGFTLTDAQKNMLGSSALNLHNFEVGAPLITTPSLNINSNSTPAVWEFAVAGSMRRDQPEPPSEALQAGNLQAKKPINGAGDLMYGGLLDEIDEENNNEVLNNVGANNLHVSNTTIVGAGAVAIEKLYGNTASLLENSIVKISDSIADANKMVNLLAEEKGTIVAVAGGLALKSGVKDVGNTTFSLAGTSAYNYIELDTISQIKDSTIEDALKVSNVAHQGETIVSAAVPMNIDVTEGATGFSGALNLSINRLDNDVHANLVNTKVERKNSENSTLVQNVAYDTSTQVTGAVNLDIAKTTVGIGVNAVWADLNNDVKAKVIGGNYTNITAFDNNAASKLTQVDVAVGVGVGSGDSGKASAGAVWTHAKVTNDIGASIDGSTISAGTLTNKAFDGTMDIITSSNTADTADDQDPHWENTILGLGIDMLGEDTEKNLTNSNLVKDVDTVKLDSNVDLATGLDLKDGLPTSGGNANTYKVSKLDANTKGGNKIYTGAVEVAGSSASNNRAAIGVAVSDTILNNDYNANIENATITLSGSEGAEVQAKSDSYIADFAVGTAVSIASTSQMINGAGSAAVSLMDNDTIASVANSTINAPKTKVEAKTTSDAVSVAGSLGFSDSKVGLGLAFAINQMNNVTKSAIYGSTLKGNNDGITELDVNAINTSKAFALGTSLAFNEFDTLLLAQGNVAVNTGKNDTVAEIEKYSKDGKTTNNTISDAKKINVSAKDTTTFKAAGAGASLSGSNGNVGVGFAVNAIKKQELAARLNNANITSSTSTPSTIDVTTEEKTNVTSVGVGLGISVDAWGSLEGYGAINLTDDKVNVAEIKNTTQTDNNQNTNVNVVADAQNIIISNADAISVGLSSSGKVNGGLAASAVDLKSDVKAVVEDSTLNAQDVLVSGKSDDKIYNVAVGASGTNSFVSVGGSTSVNKLDNDVTASVKNSTVKASDSIGVLANSNDKVVNVTGGFSIGISGTISGGLTVAVNDISGDTIASVTGSNVVAQGNGSKTFKAHEYTTGSENKMSISEVNHKGLVVDAYSNHDVTDVAVTVGTEILGDGLNLGLTGVGTSEKLSGKTEALVHNTDINKETAKQGDVTVTAVENTDINAVAVNTSVSISQGLAGNLGGSVSVANLERTVNAKLSAEEVADAKNRKVVNANKLAVAAGAKNDVDLVTVGVSVAGSGKAAGDVAALVDSVSSTYKVNSEISNINSKNNGVKLLAAHDGRLNYKGVGVAVAVGALGGAAGMGATVGVMKDDNTVTGKIENANLEYNDNATEIKDELAVTNYSEATPDIVSVVVSGSKDIAASIGVTVDSHTMNDKLKLEVVDSELGSKNKSANEAKLKVDNYYKINKDSVNVALAGAIISGSVGVLVQPITLNSGNVVNVTGSNIYADKLAIEDKETRDVDVTCVGVAGGLIAGVGVTRTYVSMGSLLQDTYSTTQNPDADEKSSEDILVVLDIANSAISSGENLIETGAEKALSQLNKAKEEASAHTRDIQADTDKGHKADKGTVSVDGQAVNVTNSNLTAKDLKVNSEIKDDVSVVSGTGGLGALAVNVNAVRIDETLKNNIKISGGSINADNASILNHVTGETFAHTIIAQLALEGINIGFADVYADGGTGITFDNANVNTKNSLLVRNLHDSTYRTRTEGGSVQVMGGTYVEAESSDKLNNTITVKDSTFSNNAKRTSDSAALNTTDTNAAQGVAGAMEFAAIKTSTAKTFTKYGAVSGLGVGTNSSTATISGNSIINFENSNVQDVIDNVSGSGITLDSYALYASRADVEMTYGGGAVAGGGGVAGHAKNTGGAQVNAKNNIFDVEVVNAKAVTGSDKTLAKVKADAFNISLGLGVGKNKIDANVNTVTKVDFKDNTFGLKEVKVVDDVKYVYDEATKQYNPVFTYKTSYVGKTDVNLDAHTNASASAEVLGVSAGIGIAVGHNGSESNTTEITSVTMDNSGLVDNADTKNIDESRTMLNSLSMHANGCNDVYNFVDGRGGGILDISPEAVDADNTSEIITDATIKGKYDVNDKVNVTAAQTDLLSVYTSTTDVGIGGNVSGATVNNTRKDTSRTAINVVNADISAGSASFIASNDVKLNSYRKGDGALVKTHRYAVDGDAFGTAVSVTDLDFTNVLNEKALVDINASNIQTKGDITVGAETTADVFATGQGTTASLGGNGLKIDVNNTYNYSNIINVANNSTLKTTTAAGDVSLSAVDDTNLQVGSYASAQVGVVTVPQVVTNNNTTRTNEINIGSKSGNDASKIDSAQDVKLYAGRYDGVAIAGLQAVIDAQTFSGSLIVPAHGRDLKNSIVENNNVNINNNTFVKSVANTDIYADEGVISIDVHNFGASSWSSDDPTKKGASYVRADSSHGNPGDVKLTQNNKALINGTIVAGNNHQLELVIGKPGSEDGTTNPEFVVLQDNLRDTFKKSNPGLNVVDKPTITVNGSETFSNDVFNLSKVGYDTVNVAASLTENYKELTERLQKYSNDTASEGYLSVKAALAQVEARLAELGMIYTGQDGSVVVLDNIKSDVISLPDISVSGGNVTISSGKLESSGGSITAYGTPVASVTNNTNLYLKLGNVNVGEKGGTIKVNDTTLTFDTNKSEAENAARLNDLINGLNSGNNVNFTKLHNEDGNNGNLEIRHDYNGQKEFSVDVPKGDGTTTTTTVRVMPDIELPSGKSITNLGGDATIHNKKGNILVNGILRADNIYVIADTGSVYENDVGILRNIGGAVEQLGTTKDEQGVEHLNQTKDDAGVISGNNIFINALSININGLLQSGYEKYFVDTTALAEKIKNADELFKAGKLPALSDDQVLQQSKDSAYCLAAGGAVFNEANKYYDYQVPVYYNPSTGTVLVGEISNGGGNIYLNGIISSTGNGRIVSMDGAPDVTINNVNDLAKDIKVYGVTTNGVKGRVTIVDTLKKTETVITRDGATVKNLVDGNETKEKLTDGTYTISPKENLRYVWVTGQDDVVRTFYQRTEESEWWGIASPDKVTKELDKATFLGDKKLEADPKGNVAAIETDASRQEDYYTISESKQTSENPSAVEITRWETGVYGFTKHELYKWHIDRGHTTTAKNSAAASKDIAVKFIGDGSTASTITIDSKGSVDIHGTIGSNTLDATVQITSTNGGINQDRGVIKSSDVTLSAAGSMKGINISSKDTLNLTAVNTADAGTTYYNNGIAIQVSDGNNIDILAKTRTNAGTVLLNGTSGNADNAFVDSFTLNSNSNIDQKNGGLISAAKVTLNASNGAIGSQGAIRVDTADVPLKSSDPTSASLNAQAQGNITIEEASGDLRVGTIYSNNGDVTLAGPGSLVDALPYDVITSSGRNEEELTQLWSEIGLLDDAKTYYTPKATQNADGTFTYEYTTTNNGFPAYDAVQKDGKTVYERKYDEAGNALFYEVQQGETIVWDPQKIIYGISDAVINHHSGLNPSNKVANIKANNINLNMKDSAGLNADKTVEYKISELGMDPELKDLKVLSKTDASSITWDAEHDKVIVNQKLPIGVYLNNENGKLLINAGQTADEVNGNVYVEARKFDSSVKAMNLVVDQINAKGTVLLNNSLGSILAANGDSVVKATNLDINAGGVGGDKADIGSKELPLNVNLSGLLYSTSTGDINIHQINKDHDLEIVSVSAGGDITFISDKGIVGHDSLSKEGTSRAYIRLENNDSTLTLVANNGNIGNETDKRINVLNVADKQEGQEEDNRKIIVEAHHTDNGQHEDDGSVYIYGNQNPTNSPEPAGTMRLDSITVGEKGTVDLDSFGALDVNGEILQADKVKLQAALDVAVAAKDLKLNNVEIIAGKHQTAESEEVKNYGGDVNIAAESIDLGNIGSSISASALQNADGSLSKGNVTINATNAALKNGATIAAEQNINLSANTSLDNSGDLTSANGDVILQSQEILENVGNVKADNGNISLQAGHSGAETEKQSNAIIINSGDLLANGNVSLKAYGMDTSGGVYALNNSGNISSPSYVDLVAENGSVLNLGEISGYALAEELPPKMPVSVAIVAANSIHNGTDADDINTTVIAKDVSMTAHKGSVNNYMNVVATVGDAAFTAGESIINHGNVVAASSNVTLNATNKFIENYGSIDAGDDAKLNAGTYIKNVGNTIAGENVSMEAGQNIANEGDIVAGTDALINAKANVANQGNMTVEGNISITAVGHVENSGMNNETGIMNAGKNIVIAAGDYVVNNSSMTAGQNASITSEHGSISNNKNADLLAQNGNVTIETKAKVGEAKASIHNEGDLAANGDIILKSANGDIYNRDAFDNFKGFAVSTGNVTISAANGSVDNTQNIIALEQVDITAKEGLDNLAYNIIAGKDINLIATAGDVVNTSILESLAGNITIKAEQGSIVNGKADNAQTGDIFAWGGNVVLEATGEPMEGETFTALDGKEYRRGSVVNYGDIVAIKSEDESAKGTITLKSHNADVFNYDDFNTLQGNDDYSGYQVSTGDVNISAKNGEVYTSKNIVSDGSVAIIAQTGLTNFAYEIYANENISLTATEGNLINNSQLVSKTGNINLNADKGTVVNLLDGNVFALGGSVNMSAGAAADAEHTIRLVDNTDGSIREQTISLPEGVPADAIVLAQYNKETDKTTVFYVTSGNVRVALDETIDGNVDVFRTGDVVNRGDVVALGQTKVNDEGAIETVKPGMVSLKSAHSNVTNYDEFDVVDGKNEITLENSDPNYNGEWFNGKKYILAKSGIGLEAPEGYFYNNMNYETDGDLTIVSKNDLIIGTDTAISHVGGNLTATSTEGKVINDAETVVGGSVTFDGDKGVTNKQDVTAETGDITFKANEGDVENTGDLDAGKDVNLTTNTGDIKNEGAVTSGEDVTVSTENGNIANNGDVKAEGDATMSTEKGDITNSGDVVAKGDVSLSTAEEGNITNSGKFDAEGNVTVKTNSGYIANSGAIESDKAVVMSTVTGDIGNTNSIDAAESVTVTTNTGNIKNEGAVTSGKDVTVSTEKGDIANSGDVKAEGDATMSTEKGDITNSGNVEAKGDVSLSTIEEGNVTNSGNLDAEGNVTVKTNSGDIENSGAIESGKAVEMSTVTGNIGNTKSIDAAESVTVKTNIGNIKNEGAVTAGEDVTVGTVTGDIENSGNVEAKGDVSLSTAEEGNITNSGKLDTEGNVTVKTNSGDIENSGAIESDKAVEMSTVTGNVGNTKSIDAAESVTVKTNIGNIKNEGAVTSGKDVTVSTVTGNIANSGNVKAEGNAAMSTDKGDIANSGDVEAKGDVSLSTTEEGNITNSGNVKAESNAAMSTEKGDIANSGDVEAKGDVSLNTAEEGNITTSGDVKAEGNVTAKTNSGNIANSGAIESGKAVEMSTVTGDIGNTNTIDAAESVTVTTNTGNIKNEGAVTSGKDVTVSTVTGNIANSGNVKAESNTAMSTDKGDIANSGDVEAKGDVSLSTTEEGNITNSGKLDAEGNVTVKTNSGDIENSGAIESDKAVEMSTVTGDIENSGKLDAEGNVSMTTESGSIANSGAIDSNANVKLDGTDGVTNTADVTADKQVEVYADKNGIETSGNITAENGLLRMWADEGNVISSGKLNAKNGSVDVGGTNGNVDIKEANAKEMVAAGSKNGNVSIGNTKGKDVVLYSNSINGNVSADHIDASDYLLVQADNAKLGDVKANENLNILILGRDGGTMEGNLDITTHGDTKFGVISAKDANVTVEDGTLAIAKLHIEDKGIFKAMNYDTAVYGQSPKYDGSKAMYFDLGNGGNPLPSGVDPSKLYFTREDKSQAISDVQEALRKLKPNGFNQGDNDGWMNLYIDDANNQRSNGTLLYHDDYHYVHNQRYSAERLAQKLADFKAVESYELLNVYPLIMFQRYDLYELDNTSFNGLGVNSYELLTEEDLKAQGK